MPEEKLAKDLVKLLDKYGYRIDFNTSFPRYRILPDEVQLALKVLSKHGMKIIFQLAKK